MATIKMTIITMTTMTMNNDHQVHPDQASRRRSWAPTWLPPWRRQWLTLAPVTKTHTGGKVGPKLCVLSIFMFWSSIGKWMLLWICIKFDGKVTKNYFPQPASHHLAHRVRLERSSYHWFKYFQWKNFWLIKDYFQIESAGFARSISWWEGNARALQWWLRTSALGGKGLKSTWENY